MPTIGDVQIKLRNQTEFSFEWRIKKIFSMPKDEGICYFCPPFFFLGFYWSLKMYPNGYPRSTKEWIVLRVDRPNMGESVLLKVGIKKADGTEEEIVRDQKLPEYQEFYLVNQFLQRSELLSRRSQLAPSDTLTITCKIWTDEPPHVKGPQENVLQLAFSNSVPPWIPQSISQQLTSDLYKGPQKNVSPAVFSNSGTPWKPQSIGQQLAPHLYNGSQQDSFLRARHFRQAQRHPQSIQEHIDRIISPLSDPYKAKTMVSRETQTESVLDTGSRAAQLDDLDVKGLYTLREHLKDLLLDGEDHDVTFRVKGQAFSARRSMLRARSPVFAAMFKHDMKESTDDPIDIVDCSPEAFGEFLRYVYTGKVENFSPSTALGLYYAGDKYNVSGLKEVCVQFLKKSLSTTTVCDVIALAAKYGEEELHELATAFFSENLEEIMSTEEWQSFLAENLVYANEMCLKAFKSFKASQK